MQVLDFPVPEILTLPPEGDENLPLGDTTKNFIRDEIKTQLDQIIDEFKPHGVRRVVHFIREWSLAATLLMAPIALLALAGAGWYYAFTRVDKEARFETNTDSRLKVIEAALKIIHDDLTKQTLFTHAVLPESDFKATLPALRSAVAAAKEQDIKPSAEVMSGLGKKLAAVSTAPEAPDFWPTAGDFLSYRSQVLLADFQDLLRPSLPNCTDKPPSPMKLTMTATEEKEEHFNKIKPLGSKTKGFSPALYENCRFMLDTPETMAQILGGLNGGQSYVLTFRHCQIVYRGGPITLWVPKPRATPLTAYGPTRSDVVVIIGQTINFENCLFLFGLGSKPNPEGQTLTRQLLSQSGPSLAVENPPATHS